MKKSSEYLEIEAAPKGYRIVRWGDITKAQEKYKIYKVNPFSAVPQPKTHNMKKE